MAFDRKVFGGPDDVLLTALTTEGKEATGPRKQKLPPVDSIVVKFREGSGVRVPWKAGELAVTEELADKELLAEQGVDTEKVKDGVTTTNKLVAKDPALSLTAMFDKIPSELDDEKRQLDNLSGEGQAPVADLNLYSYLRVADATPERMQELLATVRDLPAVEIAYVAPLAVEAAVDIAPVTSLIGPQGHLDAAPRGIDARYAWTVPGGRGRDVTIIDVEGAWRSDHEDLPALLNDGFRLNPGNLFNEGHGTAVLGILGAVDNAYGLVGIVPEARLGVSTAARAGFVPAALEEAGRLLRPGDVLVIELQYPGTVSGLVDYLLTGNQRGMLPIESMQAEFDVISRLVARGIIVVEPAGNGQVNLDDPALGGRFDRTLRDSGAIMVGAGTPDAHNVEWFTNFGSRVDVQGWGGGVTTLMGPSEVRVPGAEGDARQWYTMSFGGTSAATPIVAGAAASIQGALAAANRRRLTPLEMRNLLRDTGTPQGSGPNIGPLPNLRAALTRLNLRPPAPPTWRSLGGSVSSGLTVGHNRDGRMEVFAVSGDRRLRQLWQTAPSNGWSASWRALADGLPAHVQLMGRPAVVVKSDRNLEVFCRGSDMAVWHVWQDAGSPTGWSRWESLGGRCTSDPAVEVNVWGTDPGNRRIEVFARWENGTLHRCWQRVAGGLWSWWEHLGGQRLAGAPAAGHNADGRLEVFVRGADGLLHHIAQRSPGGDWTGWIHPGGEIVGDPVVGHTGLGANTRMEVFAVGRGNELRSTSQTAPNNGWSGVRPFGGIVVPGSRPAVMPSRDGRLHVFVRSPDGSVRVRNQLAGQSGWSDWRNLGGPVAGDPSAGINADGRLEVFAAGATGEVLHRWQPW